MLSASILPVEFHQWTLGKTLHHLYSEAQATVATPTIPQEDRPALIPVGSDPLPGGHFGILVVPGRKGQKLALRTRLLKVRVKVRGRIARTEVEQVFYNPYNRQTEGTFTFRLPYGSAITRLAMSVKGKMVEGELVERTRARAIYSSIVRKMKDPALLEWQGGNRFRTQIFPIPARGTKRILLTYDQVLERQGDSALYTYHLPRHSKAPIVRHFSFALKAKGALKLSLSPYDALIRKAGHVYSASLEVKRFRSRGILQVKMQLPPHKGLLYTGKVKGKLYGVLMLPLHTKSKVSLFKRRIFLLDTSAGMRGRAWKKATEIAQFMLTHLDPKSTFRVLAGDIDVRHFRSKWSNASAKHAAAAFIERQGLHGATDLKKMFLAAIEAAEDKTEIIYIGDGVASLGELDSEWLTDSIKKSIRKRSIRISSIAVGPNPDMGFLQKIARRTGGHSMRLHADQAAHTMARKLFLALQVPQITQIDYSVQGMKNIVRFHKGSIASGSSLLLAGELTRPAVRVHVTGTIDRRGPFVHKGVYESATGGNDPIAPAFWAKWSIRELEKEAKEKRKIIQMSQQFGVMSRYTSFLVLENDKAYKKHKIQRRRHKAAHQRKKVDLKDSAVQRQEGLLNKAAPAPKKSKREQIRQWMRLGSLGRRTASGAGGGRGAANTRGGYGNNEANMGEPSPMPPSPPAAPAADQAPRQPARIRFRRSRRRKRAKKRTKGRYRRLGHGRVRGFRRYKVATNSYYARKPIRRMSLSILIRDARNRVLKNPMNWYAHKRLVQLLMQARAYKKALVAVRNWRKYAREDIQAISQESLILKKLGREAESRRVLTELVEFSPHRFNQRVAYAQMLERLGNVTAACGQYAQAVRLNPAKRDTFKKMMGLARRRLKSTEFRDIIRQCIVKGVSRLPVVRDISVVLFWDDPNADIDLHIHEPGGQHVYYRKRESRQGGTLYYDILNGLGPEVYVLGTGKKGAYRLSLVYYSGRPKTIKTKLIVMRHAGSPRETRKVYNVTLHRHKRKKQIYVTTLRIDK